MNKYPDYSNVPLRCTNCKFSKTRRVGDSFDRGEEITCTKLNKIIDHYADYGELKNPPPLDCPLIKWKEIKK